MKLIKFILNLIKLGATIYLFSFIFDKLKEFELMINNLLNNLSF